MGCNWPTIARDPIEDFKMSHYLIFAGFLLAFAACADEQARLISTTCEALKRYFTLSGNYYNKCLSDEEYRKSLVSRRDEQWSRDISDSHNRKLMIMVPKKSRDRYIRVSQIMELPLKQATNFSRSRAEQYVGEQYVVAGTLLDETNGTDRNTDGTDKNSLVFYADTDRDRKHRVLIATDALDNDQKIFISRHCWLNTADYSTSMCHGDVYISVQREPKGHFITYELDGAAFTKSNAAGVLSLLSRYR
jgi:hypothetical protein